MNRAILAFLAAAAVSLPALAHFAGGAHDVVLADDVSGGGSDAGTRRATRVGLNMFGLQTFNRQQVFANMIAQSEWFESRGEGWNVFPAKQLDAAGWVKYLEPGQVAPRPLILPPAPFGSTSVRCTYAGKGALSAGGVAEVRGGGPQSLDLQLTPTGAEDDGAWLQLDRTDPADPVRDIDCRQTGTPSDARFDPRFVEFVSGFGVIRFMDWQRTNDNARIPWSQRAHPQSSSQAGAAGVSVEDMVDLANTVGADPWFTMPYHADEEYLRAFAELVHDRLDPERTVYVELGNEVWNDMFASAQDAQREGLARGLGGGDPATAQMQRYAERMTEAMRVWTQVYADRPQALVRVAATQNANPELARTVLGFRDSAAWIDALATAPYFWLDLDGRKAGDADHILDDLPDAISQTFAMARENQRVAAAHGKRYIAYEGGQHLVTPDLALARSLQRDPRMGDAYKRYLAGWREDFGDTLTLYASTAPISEYGSWGLREYGGQPIAEAPKYRVVRSFLEAHP
jgi:hypothetical protein